MDLENCTKPSNRIHATWILWVIDLTTIHTSCRSESLTVKIVRVYGGCLGTRRRRRTWTAAISRGETLNSL